MAWEKQFNNWERHICPQNVVSLTKVGLNIGRAAYDAMNLDDYESVDVLLDMEARRMALQLHKYRVGEFSVTTSHKNGQRAAIRCGGVAQKLLKGGVMPGRYTFHAPKKELFVIDLDRPMTRIGGDTKRGERVGAA